MKKHTLLLFLLLQLTIYGQKKNVNQDLLAVKGYDLVSYFTQNKPQKGKQELDVSWNGDRYLFVSKENRKAFKKNPDQYLPAYGGWCAYAMVKGKEIDINPKAFYIQEGQLHLFYKTNWVDTQAKWVKNAEKYKSTADLVWANKKAIKH